MEEASQILSTLEAHIFEEKIETSLFTGKSAFILRAIFLGLLTEITAIAAGDSAGR
jgi:hypothetical protein